MTKKAPFFLLAAVAGLSCDAIFPPVNNPENCALEGAPACPDGMVCDKNQSLKCVPIKNSCTGPAACPSETSAACPVDTGICTPCSADNQCTAWSTAHNHTPALTHCAKGLCIECTASTDCTDSLKPTCDATTGDCRACKIDGDCASGICRKAGDYPETPPVSGLMTGQCVSPTNIAYASNNASGCSDTGAGTMAQPYCSVAKAMTAGKAYINVLASATPYPALTVGSGNVVLIGPGRDASPTATFPSVTVNGGATLALSGVSIAASAVAPAGAVTCTAGGTLYLRDAVITNTPGRGIDAESGCAKLYVERTRINNTTAYGIIIGGTGATVTQYRIVNNALVLCGSPGTGEEYAVKLGTKSSPTGYFAYNTLNKNNKGLICDTDRTINDSIVAGSTGVNIAGCSPQVLKNVQTTADLASGAEPKLLDTAPNAACCIDKGVIPMQPQTIPTDYYGVDRPMGGGYDVGYHELK